MKDNFPGFVSQGCAFHWTQAMFRKGLQVSTIVLINVFMGKRMFLLDNKSVIVESRSADIT